MGIEDTNKYYEFIYKLRIRSKSDDSYLSATYLRERLFSFEVFCGELFITVDYNMYDTTDFCSSGFGTSKHFPFVRRGMGVLQRTGPSFYKWTSSEPRSSHGI